MFSYLEGRVTERDLDCMTVDVGGVGFLVYASPQTISQADSDRCRIYTRVVFKENGMDIFGFLTKEEREMFDRLTAVSGVGPKTALGVLGALPVRHGRCQGDQVRPRHRPQDRTAFDTGAQG